METVVLIIHLLVSICLIGLVLLQRSEGGALGMGGGGSGSLMSGRGAADALAKMTSVAGGFFLVTSLGLTVLSGAGANSGRSVFDLIPQSSAPSTVSPPAATPEPAPIEPDPTESSAPQAAETQLASAVIPAQPTATDSSQPRAAPLSASPAPSRPTATPVSAPSRQPTTPTTTPSRSTAATVVPASAPARAPVIPTTSGSSVSGINLEGDDPTGAESIEIAPVGVQPVRRERAGPDQ
jgi:preprotein translocase subunit SecG